MGYSRWHNVQPSSRSWDTHASSPALGRIIHKACNTDTLINSRLSSGQPQIDNPTLCYSCLHCPLPPSLPPSLPSFLPSSLSLSPPPSPPSFLSFLLSNSSCSFSSLCPACPLTFFHQTSHTPARDTVGRPATLEASGCRHQLSGEGLDKNQSLLKSHSIYTILVLLLNLCFTALKTRVEVL